MVRSRLGLAAVIATILVASCGSPPSVTVSIASEAVPTLLVSTTKGTPCSTTHGDGPYPPPVPTIVRAAPPLMIRVDADPGSEIRAWIYDIDAPTPSGGPLEEIMLASGETYRSSSIVAARTYDVSVNVAQSVLGFRNEVTHAFRVRLLPP